MFFTQHWSQNLWVLINTLDFYLCCKWINNSRIIYYSFFFSPDIQICFLKGSHRSTLGIHANWPQIVAGDSFSVLWPWAEGTLNISFTTFSFLADFYLFPWIFEVQREIWFIVFIETVIIEVRSISIMIFSDIPLFFVELYNMSLSKWLLDI